MEQHLPVLEIVTPLIAAPLCLLLRQRILVLAITVTVCWLTFGMAVALLLTVLDSGEP